MTAGRWQAEMSVCFWFVNVCQLAFLNIYCTFRLAAIYVLNPVPALDRPLIARLLSVVRATNAQQNVWFTIFISIVGSVLPGWATKRPTCKRLNFCLCWYYTQYYYYVAEAATEKKTNTSDQVARDDGSTADCAKSENPEEDVQKEVVSGKEADGSSVTPCTGEAGTTNMLDYSAYNMHNYQYWGMSGQYGMPYAYRHPMAAYDDSFRHSPANDAPPPPPPGEEVAPPPPDPADKPPLPPPPPGDDEPSPHPPPLPVEADANDPAVLDDGTEMDISDVEDTGTIKGKFCYRQDLNCSGPQLFLHVGSNKIQSVFYLRFIFMCVRFESA